MCYDFPLKMPLKNQTIILWILKNPGLVLPIRPHVQVLKHIRTFTKKKLKEKKHFVKDLIVGEIEITYSR